MRGQKTGGRLIGTPNKVTSVFKEAVRTVYEDIGGNTAFAEWAKENPTEFYRIAARLIPTEMASQGTNLNVIINRFPSQTEDTLLPTTQVIEHA
jgi:hypothetical protein